jgi:hypothetical protein
MSASVEWLIGDDSSWLSPLRRVIHRQLPAELMGDVARWQGATMPCSCEAGPPRRDARAVRRDDVRKILPDSPRGNNLSYGRRCYFMAGAATGRLRHVFVDGQAGKLPYNGRALARKPF